MAPPAASKALFQKRLAAVVFFALMGLLLGFFTVLDVTFHYLARKRRAGLGARPLIGAFWSLILAPTRRRFWSVGFWVAFGVLIFLLYRILAQVELPTAQAALP